MRLRRRRSHEEFLQSLELTVHVFSPSSTHVGRVTQLVNKTNQFNLTTIRRDEAEVSALVDSPDHRVYAAEVSDRFGGYGLVAVAIVARDADAWDIDTFLMSCRVLRRGVEDSILQCISEDAVAAGATTVARYLPPDGEERPGGHVLPGARLPGPRRGSLRRRSAAQPGDRTTSRCAAMLDGDPFRYFADLLVLMVIAVPAFFLAPWAWSAS